MARKKKKDDDPLSKPCPNCGRTHVGGGDAEDGSDFWIDKAVIEDLLCYHKQYKCNSCGHTWDHRKHPEVRRVIDELERLVREHGHHKELIDVEDILAFVKGDIEKVIV